VSQSPSPVSDNPAPLRQKLKDGAVALSLAVFCFAGSWFEPLYDHGYSYHSKVRVAHASVVALGVNVLWLTMLAWVVMQALRRCQNRWLHLVCDYAFFGLLLVPLNFFRVYIIKLPPHHFSAFLKQPVVAVAVLALVVFILWRHRLVARLAALILGVLSPLTLVIFAKVAFLSLDLELGRRVQPVLPPPVQTRAGQPRVVWIIFDETDYRVLFEQRPAGLLLPEFDRLRAESVCATNAYPPGDNTGVSMPALISGRLVSAVRPRGSSELELTLEGSHDVVRWSKIPSVFTAAEELGVKSALVGWYHPYSRVLTKGLSFCRWYPWPQFGPSEPPTFSQAMLCQLGQTPEALYTAPLYVGLIRASEAEALSVVTNPTYGLALLHFPPPHKPGVYLPAQHRFADRSLPVVEGYFNNLALADRILGELRKAMLNCSEWDKTWVVLSADHSWRDSPEYDGRRDLRVPFLVKAPGAGQPIVYLRAINTVLTHDLILAILRGEVTNRQQTATWLDARPFTPPAAESNPRVPVAHAAG
jgi:hypothetical protein